MVGSEYAKNRARRGKSPKMLDLNEEAERVERNAFVEERLKMRGSKEVKKQD